jgi:hypothetical protein
MKKPFRSQWLPKEPKPAPEDPRTQKAKNLEMPGPGIVITVPLHLWIEYKEIYRLEPTGIQEPKVARRDGPGEAILLVKRVRKESE